MCDTLDTFWDCSGQKMNPSKSKLYFSKNTCQLDKDLFTSHLGVPESPDLGVYLGFPLTDKRPTSTQVSHIARKIRGKLATWKAKCLSKARRLTLIKFTLTSVATYSMQSIALPRKSLLEIDQVCANFLWDSVPHKKTTHLVSWDRVCAPTTQGGLNDRKASILNQLSMIKLCWRLHNSLNLASNLVREKYVKNRAYPANFKTGSHIWQDNGKGWGDYNLLSEWCLGNGENILFWKVNWTGKGLLRNIIHGPMTLGEENRKVCEVIGNCAWNLSHLTFCLPNDITQWINAIPIPALGEDIPVCQMGKGSFFDSKSTYSFLWNKAHKLLANYQDWNVVWKSVCAPKIKIFLWLICWGRLPSASHLAYRSIIPNPNCSFCPTNEEDISHILRNFPRALEFWEESGISQHELNGNTNNLLDWLYYNLTRKDLNNKFPAPWSSVFIYSIWSLWIRRNRWVFRKESIPVDIVWKQNLRSVNEYLAASPIIKFNPSFIPLNMVSSKFVVQVDASFFHYSLSH